MNNEELVTSNINLVHYIINRYYPTYMKDEDIFQCGCLGLCKAAETWDENKSTFSTYASKCIINSINQEFRYRKKHKPVVLSLEQEIVGKDGETTTLGDLICGEEDVDYMGFDSFFEQLPPLHQEVSLLKQQGVSVREIAQKTGLSEQSVNKILRMTKYKWDNVNRIL